MAFSNLMTAAKIKTIDDELPRAAATAPTVGNALDDLYKKLIALQSITISQSMFQWDEASTTGLSFAYHDALIHDGHGALTTVASGNVTLTDAATNYVEYDRVNGVTANTTSFTTNRLPLYKVTTVAGAVPSENVIDQRPVLCFFAGVEAIGVNELDSTLTTYIDNVSPSIGIESANNIDVTLQIVDRAATPSNLAVERVLEVWLSDTNTGWETTTAPSGGISVQTGTAFDVITTDKRLRVKTDLTGKAIIRVSEAGVATWYMGIRLGPAVQWTGAITFA